MSVNCITVLWPKKFTSPVSGITANDIKQAVVLITGARTKTIRSAAFGIKSSLSANFTPSTRACNKPNFPTLFGPLRCCILATIRLSAQTDIIVRNTHAAKINKPFRAIIQPGSWPINSALLMLWPPSQLNYLPFLNF